MRWLSSSLAAKWHPLLFAGLVFVCYSMVISAAIQLIVLPYFLPYMHAGHGLLAGGDFPSLHALAARMAAKISGEGWHTWQLLPEGQSGAGVASAVYALTTPEPWVLIPMNALIHALGGVIIMKMIDILVGDMIIAFWAGALYVIFLSSLHWVSQIQKDSTYFAGMLAVQLGLVMLVRTTSRKARNLEVTVAILIIVIGMFLTTGGRLYGLDLIKGAAIMVGILIAPALYQRWRRNTVSSVHLALVASVTLLVIFAGSLIPHEIRIGAEILPVASKRKPGSTQDTQEPGSIHPVIKHWHSAFVVVTPPPAFVPPLAPEDYIFRLPVPLERAFLRISIARWGWTGNTYASASSMIDIDVQFFSAHEVIEYLPRALQIGFLAPFPYLWVTQGSSAGGTTTRRVAAVEMMILYQIFLIGLPLAAWRWRRRLEFWMTMTFFTPIIVAYACVLPNLGTLYRIRYGFLMSLAAVGFAAIWLTLQDGRNHKKQSSSI